MTPMRSRGFSLIEFMIAMTIGLFMVAGLVYLISETSRSRAEIERSSRQIENGRYALDRMAEDIRHAGFYSEYFDLPVSGAWNFPATLTAAAPCAATIGIPGTSSPLVAPTGLHTGMALGIQAYDGGASVPSDLSACINSADYQPNTDILVIRRASTTAFCPTGKTCAAGIPSAAVVANQTYIQTTPVAFKIDSGANVASFNLTNPASNTTATTDAPLRRYLVRIYFVAKCNVPASGATCNGTTDDNGTPIPTLKMLELGAGPAFEKLAVAEGIEQLQFDFGIDTSADGVPDTISMCTACTTAEFSNVTTAQIFILARNTERSPGYSDDKTYSLGLRGYYTPTELGYRRHAYSAQVRLNNVAMRRE